MQQRELRCLHGSARRITRSLLPHACRAVRERKHRDVGISSLPTRPSARSSNCCWRATAPRNVAPAHRAFWHLRQPSLPPILGQRGMTFAMRWRAMFADALVIPRSSTAVMDAETRRNGRRIRTTFIGHWRPQAARFSHQQSIDLAAKARDADPLGALRSGISDRDLAASLDQTAARFQWNSRWKGWRLPPEGRLKRGLGASVQSAQPQRIDPQLAVICFVDLEFDGETGSVSLNSVAALANAPGLLSQDASVVEAGIMEGLFGAFHHDPNSAKGSVQKSELFPPTSRLPSTPSM